MNTYIAITIGPLYKTFQNVRRTRELWAASFCFSFLMRNINKQLRRKDGVKSEDFILPYFEKDDEEKLLEKLKGYGFFPDCLIFKSKTGDLDLLLASIDDAFSALASIVAEVLSADKTDIILFLKNYFQISYIEKELSATEDKNAILALSPYLNTLELQNKFFTIEPEFNYLYKFFTHVNDRKTSNKRSFLDDYFEIIDVNKKIRVESLIEIATRELKEKTSYIKHLNAHLWDEKNNSDKDNEKPTAGAKASDSAFLEALITECQEKYSDPKKNPFQSYHKYYCILQADGDKMGTTLQGLTTDSDVKVFSNHLSKWAMKTYDEVKAYKGVPIYIGGDDLLCIVPVCNGTENVFDLIRNIDTIFKTEFTKAIPSLSFGLSITYYKYPLAEAFNESYELLKKAKKAGGNRIAAQIIKHSGSEMISIFDKSSELYTETLSNFLKLLDNKEASNSAITYKLRDNEKVFELIGLLPNRVTYFINHLTDSKDEGKGDFDKLNKDEKFMRLVKDTISRVYKQKADEVLNQNMEKISKAAMKEIYSMLRIVKFVKGIDDDKS